MEISDPRFGAELRTTKGKFYKFDSLDCMVPFYQINRAEIAEVWIADSFSKGALIEASQAFFVKVDGLRSPMGVGILASNDRTALTEAGKGAPLMDWATVLSNFSGSNG